MGKRSEFTVVFINCYERKHMEGIQTGLQGMIGRTVKVQASGLKFWLFVFCLSSWASLIISSSLGFPLISQIKRITPCPQDHHEG